MIRESFNSWPGYYASPFSVGVRHELEVFLKQASSDELDCHAMFNILEHRTTLMVLGDLVIKALNLQPVWNARCRDFDEAKLGKLVSDSERLVMTEVFGDIHRKLPHVHMPPGRNLNSQSKIQILVRRTSQYSAAALTIRYHEPGAGLTASVDRILKRKFLLLLFILYQANSN
jgi:hypothetical protein